MNSLTLQRVIVVAMAFWTRVNAKSSKAAKSSKNQKEPCHLSFDIHGNPEAFKPYKYIEVSDQGCDYTATIKFDLVNAGMPMPTNPSEDCDLASTACNGMSCLHEVRNLYMLGNDFENFTGFNHIGIDWSPCGHPPMDKFAKPHYNYHLFRVTPEARERTCCVMDNPFVCSPLSEQTYSNGVQFYVWGEDTEGHLANVPESFRATADTAVPGEGCHAWNHDDVQDVADWDRPLLIEGLYGGTVQFWEPMVPYEFVSGNVSRFYEESVSYVSQTIDELPSYWSMGYDPASNFTTLTLKGRSKNCHSA